MNTAYLSPVQTEREQGGVTGHDTGQWYTTNLPMASEQTLILDWLPLRPQPLNVLHTPAKYDVPYLDSFADSIDE